MIQAVILTSPLFVVKVKNRWKELTEQEHAHVSQLAFNNVGIGESAHVLLRA